MDVGATHTEFLSLIEGPEESIDLARAALAIARPEYDQLDVQRYVDALTALALEAAPRVSEAGGVAERIARLNEFLYELQGFTGNQDDYYDARNSYLNEVLDRRTGIPITLAIVYIEIAARLGLSIQGVGFPGHFLVKCVDDGEILVDPFAGEILSRDDCRARYSEILGQGARFDPRALEATPKRHILARLLGNLKQIHLAQNHFERALRCSERIGLLLPEMATELRDQGLLLARLGLAVPALERLEQFLALVPDDPSAAAIRAQLPALRSRQQTVH